jgi:hypothetical protein
MIAILVRHLFLISVHTEPQEFLLLQIHLFQDGWGSNTVAAWVAVL